MLVDQWQDELREKLHLPFEIVTWQMIDAAYSGNPFLEKDLLIARLDHLSRSEELLAKLSQSEWDLVICDEAHKMSAQYFGSEVKETKRYKLGMRLGEVTRHLLLMTATPHSGKPEEFDLFMALLDYDRFAGKVRGKKGRGKEAGARDMMRRLSKEQLRHMDGRPLFPERRAYAVKSSSAPHTPISEVHGLAWRDPDEGGAESLHRPCRPGKLGEPPPFHKWGEAWGA